jgi:GMP synthase-like glutamine amidotransferase
VDAEDDILLPVGVMPVVQWHYDTVTTLPPSAVLLASSTSYPVQAFRVGEVAWGLQFHIEATPDMVRDWAAHDDVDPAIADAVEFRVDALRTAGEQVARAFARIVTG